MESKAGGKRKAVGRGKAARRGSWERSPPVVQGMVVDAAPTPLALWLVALPAAAGVNSMAYRVFKECDSSPRRRKHPPRLSQG